MRRARHNATSIRAIRNAGAKAMMADEPQTRVERLDWAALRASIDDRGYAVTPALLTASECRELIAL
jgi:hypothetical protein